MSQNPIGLAVADPANPWSAIKGEPYTTYEYEVLHPGFELEFSAGLNPASTNGCDADTKFCQLTTTVPNSGLTGLQRSALLPLIRVLPV